MAACGFGLQRGGFGGCVGGEGLGVWVGGCLSRYVDGSELDGCID